ncbi:hypothetical protein H4582DRAFT_1039001 [Lactarius indigo]|nr:hypothetical protein H4582DRAFT_1039001 [Lactarius indigo]
MSVAAERFTTSYSTGLILGLMVTKLSALQALYPLPSYAKELQKALELKALFTTPMPEPGVPVYHLQALLHEVNRERQQDIYGKRAARGVICVHI